MWDLQIVNLKSEVFCCPQRKLYDGHDSNFDSGVLFVRGIEASNEHFVFAVRRFNSKQKLPLLVTAGRITRTDEDKEQDLQTIHTYFFLCFFLRLCLCLHLCLRRTCESAKK